VHDQACIDKGNPYASAKGDDLRALLPSYAERWWSWPGFVDTE